MNARFVRLLPVIAIAAAPLHGQSLMYRPPNLGGTWVPEGGVVQFNFIHRFYVAPAIGAHKVTNFPTFTVGAGLGTGLALGLHYGSNSFVSTSPYRPNEAEVYARYRWGKPEGAEGLALALTPAYNSAAQSADGELGVDYTRGALTLSGAARGMTHPYRSTKARAGFAGGFVVRLSDYIALSGDVGSLVGPTTRAAWSAAVDFVIPGSPHTFSLQVSNATTSTIEGNSQGFAKKLYGFEFTIPLHLSRFSPWFRKPAAPAAGVGGPVAASIEVHGFRFRADTITVAVGETVRWTNADPLEHTITFDDGTDSGRLAQRASYVRRFDRPGTYTYHCTPHPYMKGVVVVR